jgi:hypothetical protein
MMKRVGWTISCSALTLQLPVKEVKLQAKVVALSHPGPFRHLFHKMILLIWEKASNSIRAFEERKFLDINHINLSLPEEKRARCYEEECVEENDKSNDDDNAR